MRLDKYLKVSRLIKRRTVANEACDSARISVNGKAAKASYDVKINDLISVSFGSKNLTVKVLDIKETTKKSEAVGMYEIISDEEA
jgi:ribosomal 50S subunit-recycling heat shock protein